MNTSRTAGGDVRDIGKELFSENLTEDTSEKVEEHPKDSDKIYMETEEVNEWRMMN